jgi:uncharacterized GH25 family protein
MAHEPAPDRARRLGWLLAAGGALALLLGGLAVHGFLSRAHDRDPQALPTNGPELAAEAEKRARATLEGKAGRAGEAGRDPTALAEASEVTLVVRTAQDEPVEGVALDVLDDGSEWDDPVVLATVATDGAGRASVLVKPGDRRVRARHARFLSDVVHFTAPRDEPVVVPLWVGVPLRVLVTDLDDKPIAGARVRERELSQGAAFTTGADGIADLGAVHGTWAGLLVDAPGHLPKFAWANEAWKRDPGTPLKVRVVRAGPLVVRVLRDQTHVPEPGASIWVRHDRGDARGTTDASGIVRFDAAVAAPSVEIRVTTPDDRTGTLEINGVTDYAPREVRVLVSAGRTVSGVVRRSTDRGPVADASVFQQQYSGAWVEIARTDAAGRFRLEHVAGAVGDPVDVRVRAAGWAGPDEKAEAPPSEPSAADGNGEPRPVEEDAGAAARRDASLEVLLLPTPAVTGRVMGPDGKPVAGAKVEASFPSTMPPSPTSLVATTDREGRYRIEDVPPWEHLAVIAESDALGVKATHDTLPDPVDGVIAVPDLVLPGTWDLDVPVVDEDGRPVPVAWLEIRQRVRTRGELFWRRTVSEGRFHRVPGLSRDGVGVTLAAPGFLPDAFRADAKTTQIVANRPCRIRGRLVDAQGQPLASQKVKLTSKERLSTLEGNAASAQTDAEGRFEAAGLRRGRYEVEGRGGEIVVTADQQQVGDVVVRGDPR